MNWSLIKTILIGAAACAALTPAQASQQQEKRSDIIVTGKRETDKKQAEHFVQQIVATDIGQLARFVDPVCPEVLGLSPRVASAIEGRIRAIAATVNAPLGKAGCQPNLVAVVSDSADNFIRFMRKRHASFFDDLSDVDVHDAFKTGDVHSWRLIENRDEDGGTAVGDPPLIQSYGASPFSVSTQAATVNAVMVIDRSVVLNKTGRQLAGYIAMRTLAGARPPKRPDGIAPTILSLFDKGANVPATLTDADLKFLSGLYVSTPTTDAPSQAYDIVRQMTTTALPASRTTNGKRGSGTRQAH